MRRILLVLTVAALMAAMMVTAGPAKANVDVDVDGGSGFDVEDGFGFNVSDGFLFDLDDDDDDDEDNDINNAFVVRQVNGEAGDIDAGGVEFFS